MKDNWYQLGLNPNSWYATLIENLTRKIPEAPRYVAGVEISKFDPSVGDADGLIYLLGGKAAIPIIIRNGRLAPLDILVSNQEDFYPVNELFLQKIYADNVIGEPATGKDNDADYTGPAKRVLHKSSISKTAAEMIKEACIPIKLALKDELTKSASLMTFFNTYDKELLYDVLSTEEAISEKVAAVEEEPEADGFHLLVKTEDGFSYNGSPIHAKFAGELMSMFGLTQEKKASVLLEGGIVCVDERPLAKRAEVVEAVEAKNVVDDNGSYYIAEVVDAEGVPRKGALCRISLDGPYIASNPRDRLSMCDDYEKWLFVTDGFWAVQDDIKILDYTPTTAEALRVFLHAEEPTVGACGLVLCSGDQPYLRGPINVAMVNKAFKTTTITDSTGIRYSMRNDEFFYTLPGKQGRLMETWVDGLSEVYGQTYIVSALPDGTLVFNNEANGYTNMLYTLMRNLNLPFEDAKHAVDTALLTRTYKFKTAGATAKKVEKAPAKQQPIPKAQSAMVSFDGIQDVAKLNDPTLMDAYLSGRLADINVMGRENMMIISDKILEAIKAVAKLLFLIRMGKVDYVNEEDSALALSKLGDVAKSVGISSLQLT